MGDVFILHFYKTQPNQIQMPLSCRKFCARSIWLIFSVRVKIFEEMSNADILRTAAAVA